MAYRNSSQNQDPSASATVPVPSGIAENDIIIAVISVDYLDALHNISGFTSLDNSRNTVDGQRTITMWKRATGSESGSFDWGYGGNNWASQCYLFSGRHLTNPPVATGNVNTSQNTLPITITATGVTAVAGDDLLLLGAPDCNNTLVSSTYSSWPSGFNERITNFSGWAALGGATKENVSAGSTGDLTVQWTCTTAPTWAGWAGVLIRIPSAGEAPLALSVGTVNREILF